MIVLYLLQCFFILCQSQGGPSGSGPKFGLSFESEIYVCPDDVSRKFLDTSGINILQVNETLSTLSGSFEFLDDLDELTMVEVKVEKEAHGHYEMVMSYSICPLCSEIGNPDSAYYDYMKDIGFPDACPLLKGLVHVHDLIADTTDIPMNNANMGAYQATLTLNKDTSGSCKPEDFEFIACLKFDFMIDIIDV